MSLLHKNLSVSDLDLKFSEEKPGFFSGYASKFNGIDAYGDTIVPGAYKNTLMNRDRPVQLRWNHFGPVIGKFTKMKEDGYGLYVEGELTPGHSVADDTRALMKHGAISGMSIGFRIKDCSEKSCEDAETPEEMEAAMKGGRVLKEIDLVEISIVETPADLGATIGDVKSHIGDVSSIKELEGLLRDATGLSHSVAKAFIGKVAELKGLRDVEPDAAASDEARSVELSFAFHNVLSK